MIMLICIVKATRSQNPAPNHCAVCITGLPIPRHATKTIATATSANANASGNQRSNQSESCKPIDESRFSISLLASFKGPESEKFREEYQEWKRDAEQSRG